MSNRVLWISPNGRRRLMDGCWRKSWIWHIELLTLSGDRWLCAEILSEEVAEALIRDQQNRNEVAAEDKAHAVELIWAEQQESRSVID